MFIFFIYRHISYRALFAFLQGGTLVLLPCTCVISFDLLACTLIDSILCLHPEKVTYISIKHWVSPYIYRHAKF